jgi:predicted Rossmann fold nucleotide-binding protein DprA/Smf involved in DNA uptake
LIEALRRVATAAGGDPDAVVAKYESVLKTETDGTMRKRLLGNEKVAAAVAAIAAKAGIETSTVTATLGILEAEGRVTRDASGWARQPANPAMGN